MRLYRVETLAGPLGFPVELEPALVTAGKRLPKLTSGDTLRVVPIDYELDPATPPTLHTPAERECWRGTVVRFPDIGTLGVYVCKPASQHRYGNAGDWAAPRELKSTAKVVAYLEEVFEFHRRQGKLFEKSAGAEGLPVSEVIFRDKITTRARGWRIRTYTGTFHAAHVHQSAYPLISTTRPCGA